VWFGEAMPEAPWDRAVEAAEDADLMLVVGTSGLVYPAASLPKVVARRGRPVVVINPTASELDAVARVVLRGAAGEVLPVVVAWNEL
jgi:NAD-dependent deacetylase